MPEDTTTTTVAAPSPVGIEGMMNDVMTGVDAADPPKPDAKPDKAEPPPKADKPVTQPKDAKPAPVKPDPAKPAAKPADKPPEKPANDMNQLRRRHDELLANEKKNKAEIQRLQEETKTLAAKRYLTPEIEKEIEENKAEIVRLKTHVAEAAYEHSDEFKSKYVEPWQRTLQGTLAMVEQMSTPAFTDENGNEYPARKTTQADFQRVLAAPVGEQSEMAQKLFGANALRILTQIDKLNDLKQQAEASIKAQATTLEGKRKQMESWEKEQRQKYTTLRESARQELVEKYPQFFAPDETDPEASEALAAGFAFVDKASNGAEDLSPDERAAYSEVIRARAAWFPRGFRQLSKLQEKVKSLEDELAKYRESDPGSGREKADVKEKPSEFGTGIEGLASQIAREMAG
jgi:chromosome segregation ATPase